MTILGSGLNKATIHQSTKDKDGSFKNIRLDDSELQTPKIKVLTESTSLIGRLSRKFGKTESSKLDLFLVALILVITFSALIVIILALFPIASQKKLFEVFVTVHVEDTNDVRSVKNKFEVDKEADTEIIEISDSRHPDGSDLVLHDFSMNFTAIVDMRHHRCLVKRLNRHLIKPPISWSANPTELDETVAINEIYHESYSLILPNFNPTSLRSKLIDEHCHMLPTYRMKKPEKDVGRKEEKTEYKWEFFNGYHSLVRIQINMPHH